MDRTHMVPADTTRTPVGVWLSKPTAADCGKCPEKYPRGAGTENRRKAMTLVKVVQDSF